MFRFSPAQFAGFAQASFIDRVVGMLPGADPQDAALRADLAQQMARARERGFVDEADCARWMVAAWYLGADFDRRIVAIDELLARDDLGAGFKAWAIEVMVRAVADALGGRKQVLL